MISWIGQWTRTPSTTPLQPKKWNACFWITFNFWWSARLVDGLEPHLQPLSSQKKWNAHFWIMFNFWWSARVVNGLKSHLPPLSSQKNEMLIFGLRSTSDDWPGWSKDSNLICDPSPAKNMKCLFLDYIQLLMIGQAGRCTRTPFATSVQPKKWNAHFWITFNSWWSARLVNELEPHLPPLSSHKNKMLIFGLRSTSDDKLDWSMDSNAIHHPSPAKNMKCLFLDYIQLLMISQAGRWTWTPSATHLQPKKWNANFWISFNFWWLPGLVDGLEPHLPPICSQKMKCSFLGYVQLLMISQAGQWTQTPSATHLQPKTWNACFWITFNFWWSVGLVDGIEPHLPPLSSQKNEMLIFGLRSTSDDWPGWSMDLSPVCHLFAAKKMKCPFLDYIQLLMIGRAGPRTPPLSATPLQPKTWNACFWITFNFWWSARLVDALEPHLPPLSSQKHEMLIFGLHSTPDDRPGWSMDSNPIYHLSPATKIKCSFLDYIQLLMISWIGQWTRMPSTTPLQPKTWNACFWITFNFWWLARLVDALKPHLPPLSSQKIEMLIFGLHSTSDDQPGWSMELNPIYHLSPAKKNEMLIFGLHSNSDDKPGWLMDSNPICHPSPAKRMKS